MVRELGCFSDKLALARCAADRLTVCAARCVRENRPFRAALAGGSTPATLYSLLAQPSFRDLIVWENAHLFFGDERCVPPEDERSNYRMAREALLANVPIPAENVYRMPAEQPDPDSAAQAYEAELRRAFGIGAQAWPRFDLVLLGMGADGHCASLFPRKPALRETTRLVVATEPGLEPFVPRLTLTYPVLNQAANVVFLVAGAEKAQTLARVLEGPFDPDALPAQAVAPSDGTLTWLFDTAAATRLQAF